MTVHTYYPNQDDGFEMGDPHYINMNPQQVDEPNVIVTVILSTLMVIFTVILLYLVYPFVHHWWKKLPPSPARVERRYQTIENWLITKKAKAHCDKCETIQQNCCTTLPKVKLATSHDTAETFIDEDTELECPVCMEAFAENEIVSWSPDVACGHVFHHECIKSWLLNHDSCPICRVVFLPVDQQSSKRKKWTTDHLADFTVKRSKRLATTYYCLEEGLVALQRSPDELASSDSGISKGSIRAMKRMLRSGVQQGELVRKRGDRVHSNDKVVDIRVETHIEGMDSSSRTQSLDFANAVVDIELCMTQLRDLSSSESSNSAP